MKNRPKNVSSPTQEKTFHPWHVTLPAGIALALVALCSAAAGWIVLQRISSNFDNEWVESQIAASCIRVAEGLPLYPPPSPVYVGDNYPPLYFWICGSLTAMVGHPMMVCRWVSVISTLLICVAIAWVPRRSALPIRVFLAGCFLAFYCAAFEWYDLARIDMLAHALGAWGCFVAIRGHGLRSAVLAGILLGLSVITKHNLVIVAAAFSIGLLLQSVRRGLIIGAITAAIPAITFVTLHLTSDGWSTHYLFIQPSQHEFISKKFFQFLDGDIGAHGMILMVILAAWAIAISQEGGRRAFFQKALPPIMLALGGIGATLPARLKFGGAANNLIPMWTFLLIALAWTIPEWFQAEEGASKKRSGILAAFWVAMIGVGLSLCGSFGPLWGKADLYENLSRRDHDIKRYHERIEELSRLGPVWATRNSLYSMGNASKTMAHGAPIRFLQNTDAKPAHDVFYESLKDYLTGDDRPAAIVLNYPFHPEFARAIQRWGYLDGGLLLGKTHYCKPLTGYQTYPNRILVRRDLINAVRRVE